MATIKLVPIRRSRLYECFDCGYTFKTTYAIGSCPRCGADDKLHEMD